MPSHFQLRRL